jgi:hypothetical protein
MRVTVIGWGTLLCGGGNIALLRWRPALVAVF